MVKREQQTAVRPLVFELYPPASEDRRPVNRAKVILYQAPPWLPKMKTPVCCRASFLSFITLPHNSHALKRGFRCRPELHQARLIGEGTARPYFSGDHHWGRAVPSPMRIVSDWELDAAGGLTDPLQGGKVAGQEDA